MPLINPNLSFLSKQLRHKERSELFSAYQKKQISYEQYQAECQTRGIKSGLLLEGSSRSGKTTAAIDFQVMLTSTFETNATINVIRDTYNSFKTTLYDDYAKRLSDFGIVDNPFLRKQEISTFKLFGNRVNFLGADGDLSKFMGAGSDYVYFNEVLDIPKEVFDQATMRCRKFWFADFNPKYADHYIFNSVMPRSDVGYLKTTYHNNPFISPNERSKIESYQPIAASRIAKAFGAKSDQVNEVVNAVNLAKAYDTKANTKGFDRADLSELERCKYNEATGTADAYNWSVYGEGERRAPEGLIFPNVVWVQNFPANIEKIYWGLDFGYTTSPSALVKVGVMGNNIYLQKMFYQPTPSPNELMPLLKQNLPSQGETVWADPSGDDGGRGMIAACRREGFRVLAANTYPGSRKFGNSALLKYRIHIVDCPEWRKEQSGYTKARARVNGIWVTTDDPIDGNDHLWDATRMTVLGNRL